MFKKLGLAAVASICAGAVTAQSMPSGFYVEGDVRAEYLSGSSVDSAFGFADVTVGYNIGSGFGVELYLDVDADESSTDSNIGGIVYYDTSYGRFSLGTPESAYDTFGPDLKVGHSEALTSQTISGLYSGLTSFSGAYADSGFVDVYGASFVGQSGAVSYALSYHDIEFIGDAYAIAAEYQFGGNYTASFAVEGISFFGFQRQGGKIAIEADYGKFGGALVVAKPVFPIFDISVGLEGTYDVTDNIELYAGAQTLAVSSASVDTYYVGAEYSFMDNAILGASYTDGSPFTGGDITTLYAEYSFSFGG